jgi:geranylgeranyl diphosphate synthase type I
MSFIDFVQTTKPELETAILEFLEKKSTEYSRVPLYSESIKKINTLSLAGKMWRGLFVLFILQQITGSYTKESLHAAIAMELIQTSLLTHDDIIDNDMTRRGMPTIYAQYAQNGSIEYGKNMGICVGDIAIFLAYEALVQSNTTPAATHGKMSVIVSRVVSE